MSHSESLKSFMRHQAALAPIPWSCNVWSISGDPRWCNLSFPAFLGSCSETIWYTFQPRVEPSNFNVHPSPFKHSTWISMSSLLHIPDVEECGREKILKPFCVPLSRQRRDEGFWPFRKHYMAKKLVHQATKLVACSLFDPFEVDLLERQTQIPIFNTNSRVEAKSSLNNKPNIGDNWKNNHIM